MRSVLALVSCLCVALLIAPGAQAAKRGKKCRSAQSTTVRKNDAVRLYETDGVQGPRLWGCLRRSGKKRFLTASTGNDVDLSEAYTHVLLAGYRVAWSFETSDVSCRAACPPDYSGQTFSIHVYNLRTKRSRDITVPSLPVDKVLTRRGGLAWVQTSDADGELEVLGRDRNGTRVLAHGGNIRDLSLKRYTVSWVKDGVRGSAKLR